MQNKCLMLSGGLDSFMALTVMLGERERKESNFFCFHVRRKTFGGNCDYKYALMLAKKVKAEIKIMVAPKWDDLDYMLQNRNYFYASRLLPIMPFYKNIDSICWGKERMTVGCRHRQDIEMGYPDETNDVEVGVDSWDKAMNENVGCRSYTPFNESFQRFDYLIEYPLHGLDPVYDSWSCWRTGADGKECGKCMHCHEKVVTLLNGGYKYSQIKDRFDRHMDTDKKFDQWIHFTDELVVYYAKFKYTLPNYYKINTEEVLTDKKYLIGIRSNVLKNFNS